MEFNFKMFNWSNQGAEPSEEVKEKGFLPKYKPAAGIFNYFFHIVTKAISELQEKFGNHAENKDNPHGVTKTQLGLDKVDNTSDSEKSVKFASEAGEGRKVKYDLSIRFNGGASEGVDLWTYNGSTSRSINITPKKIKAAEEAHTHDTDDINGLRSEIDRIVAATSTDGVNYTATIEGITELYNGLTITIIPNMLSTSKNTTLNVNGLGAKQLRCSLGGYNFGNSGTIAALDGWLGVDSPVTIQYKAKFDNWQTIISRPSVSGLYGTVKVEQGGTGATDAETARENLGITPINIGALPESLLARTYPVATFEELDAALNTVLNEMASHSVREFEISFTAAIQPFGGGTFISKLYKMGDEYAVVEMRVYETAYPKTWVRSLFGGIWQDWVYLSDSSHNHSASIITAGELGGRVMANANASANLSNSQVRNINAGTTNLVAGSSSLGSGCIYCVYE